MADFGDVWGLPFTIEGIAFFLEAIFLGLYLYGWDRFSPRAHLLVGLPIPVAGVASAWFVVTANAWMNQPRGFDVEHYLATGEVTDVDPWAAMFNPATPVQTTHMVLAAIMVAGLRGGRGLRRGLAQGPPGPPPPPRLHHPLRRRRPGHPDPDRGRRLPRPGSWPSASR